MEFLGIGPTELLLIVAIALIVINPKDWKNTGRTIGEWLNKVGESEGWQAIRTLFNEASHLPNRLRREANFEKFLQEGAADPPLGKNNKLGTWSGGENHILPDTTKNSIEPRRSMAHYPSLVAEAAAAKPEEAKKAPKKKAASKKSTAGKKPAKKRAGKPSSKRGAGKKSNA